MQQTILITGASSGFGAMTAKALARAGHRVYASMRDPQGRGGAPAAEVERLAREENLAIRAIALDVLSEPSIEAAVETILAEAGRIDVVIHNAGHLVFGPTEASHQSNWRSSTTSMCWGPSASTGQSFPPCARLAGA